MTTIVKVIARGPQGPPGTDGGGGGAPSGPAGGVLSGTYPDPGFAVDMATQAELDAEASVRSSADTTLASAISSEASTRATGDTNAVATAEAYTDTQVASEASARAAADGLKLAKASNLSDLADPATARANLGLAIGSDVQAHDPDLDIYAGITPTSIAQSILAAANAAAIRTLLSLVPGTDVQIYDADLAALAGLTSAANQLPYFSGPGSASLTTLTAFIRTLLDDADAATALSTLGALAATAVPPSAKSGTLITPHPVTATGAGTLTQSLLCCSPVWIPKALTINQIGTRVTTTAGSSTIRLGIYADDGNGYPGSLVIDGGTIDSSSSTGDKYVTVSKVLGAGLYWFAACAQGGTPGSQFINNVSQLGMAFGIAGTTGLNGNPGTAFIQSGVTGALPSSFTSSTTVTATAPRVFASIT